MFSHFFRPTPWVVITAGVLLAGCTLLPPVPRPAEPPPPAAAQGVVPQPVLPQDRQPVRPVVAAPPANAISPDDTPPVIAALAYADRLRAMAPPDVGAELTRLGDARSPSEQLQLALALTQLRQTPDLIRAQDLLTRLLANASGDAATLHPLARLLAQRLGEQRRVEDLLDKQSQQTRDTQRRLEQTTERLEALKAIERSLGGTATAPGRSPVGAAPARARPTP